MMTGAPSSAATSALESPMTAPTPACPVPSSRMRSRPFAISTCAARIRALKSSTTSPSITRRVKPRGICTGERRCVGSGRSKTSRISAASSSAGAPLSMIQRCPTGFMKAVFRPRSVNAANSPSEAVVLPRFCPVAARKICRAPSAMRATPRRVAPCAVRSASPRRRGARQLLGPHLPV